MGRCSPISGPRGSHSDETNSWAENGNLPERVPFFKTDRKRELSVKLKHHASSDFTMAAEVLDESLTPFTYLKTCVCWPEKRGLFDFNLREILDEFVGDVQIFTEFTAFRHIIIGRSPPGAQANLGNITRRPACTSSPTVKAL